MSKKGSKKDKKRKIREIEKDLKKRFPPIIDKSGRVIPRVVRFQRGGKRYRKKIISISELLPERVERKAGHVGEVREQDYEIAENEQIKPYGVLNAKDDPYINKNNWIDNIEMHGKFYRRVSKIEYFVTLNYYGLRQDQEDIGKEVREVGMSQSGVSQIITKMWDKLRKKYKESEPEFWEYCLEIRASRSV